MTRGTDDPWLGSAGSAGSARGEGARDGGRDRLGQGRLGQGRLGRVLPTSLVGAGRRPAWRRTRLRRVVSAALVAAAVGLALNAVLPQPAARGVPVVVVAEDLMAGHLLTPGDLAVADWPLDLRPAGSVSDPATLSGRVLGAGMSRGEPVTTARLRGPGLLAGVPSGLMAAHVRVADPAMAAMTGPGDRVDLISSTGKVVAADVAVIAVDLAPAGGGGWSSVPGSWTPAGVVVAVARDAAVRLATADPSGLAEVTVSLVLRASGDRAVP